MALEDTPFFELDFLFTALALVSHIHGSTPFALRRTLPPFPRRVGSGMISVGS